MKNISIPSGKVSNLNYLTELAKGNTAFIKEMLDIFKTDNPGEIEALGKAIAETDYTKIRDYSHHMLSTIPFIGLDVHVGQALAETEELAKTKSGIEAIRENFKLISAVCKKAQTEL